MGFHVSIVYSICAEVNPLNLKLLEQVKEFFGGAGSISKSGNMYFYEISSVKSLLNVRRHFEDGGKEGTLPRDTFPPSFPLQTTKYIHFKL